MSQMTLETAVKLQPGEKVRLIADVPNLPKIVYEVIIKEILPPRPIVPYDHLRMSPSALEERREDRVYFKIRHGPESYRISYENFEEP